MRVTALFLNATAAASTRAAGSTIRGSSQHCGELARLAVRPADRRSRDLGERVRLDDKGSDVVIQANTVIDANFGIVLHAAARTSVQSNPLFANRRSQIWTQEDTN